MKYIREARFGQPGTLKTRNAVGTYPQPLLDLSFDMNGWSSLSEPVSVITAEQLLKDLASKTPPAPITVVDFFSTGPFVLTELYVPTGDELTFGSFCRVVNALYKNCPFKTVVVDTITGLSDSIYNHQAAKNSAALADARKWAGNIGSKIGQIIDVLHKVQAHTVCIFHSEVDKHEDTTQIRELVMVYSKLREAIANRFDQFFYAEKGGKVRTKPYGILHGVKCRWPHEIAELCNGDYTSIYVKEKFD